jgi:hypothetical protein
LEDIKYEKYNLNICGYLKVIALLLGKVSFCLSGIVGKENIVTTKNSGLKENRLLQERKM